MTNDLDQFRLLASYFLVVEPATVRSEGMRPNARENGQIRPLDQAFGLPEVLVAVSTSRLSCKSAGKTRTLMPVWDSSGESRITIGSHEIGLGERVGAADRIQICGRREHLALQAPGT